MGKGRPAHTPQVHFQMQIKVPIFEGLVPPHSQIDHVRHNLFSNSIVKCWCLRVAFARGRYLCQRSGGYHHKKWKKIIRSQVHTPPNCFFGRLHWLCNRACSGSWGDSPKPLAFQRHMCQSNDWFGHPDQTNNNHQAEISIICENSSIIWGLKPQKPIPWTQSSQFSRSWWDNLIPIRAPGRGSVKYSHPIDQVLGLSHFFSPLYVCGEVFNSNRSS